MLISMFLPQVQETCVDEVEVEAMVYEGPLFHCPLTTGLVGITYGS
jgi:hypothetical protein